MASLFSFTVVGGVAVMLRSVTESEVSVGISVEDSTDNGDREVEFVRKTPVVDADESSIMTLSKKTTV
jgi:hypothetical protein